MSEINHFRRFFKDYNRALQFRDNVDGELFYKDSWEYELELTTVDDAEAYKEFEYLVTWEGV